MQKVYVFIVCCMCCISIFSQTKQPKGYRNSRLVAIHSNDYSYDGIGKRSLRGMTEDGEIIHVDLDSHVVLLSKKKRLLDMDTLLSTEAFLFGLRLSPKEQRFYPVGIKRGVIKPPRIVSMCVQGKTLVVVYKASFIHEITQADMSSAPATRIAELKLNLGSRVIRSKNLFVWLDLETLKLTRTATVEKPNGYWPDQMSPCAFVHEHEVYLPIQPDVQSDSLINDSIFAAKNYVLGKFEWRDSALALTHVLPYLRPSWFTSLLNVNDYSNGTFQTVGTSLYYYLSWYPYLIDVKGGKEYLVPEPVLQEVAKQFGVSGEHSTPVFSMTGVIKSSKALRLLARVSGTDTILCFKFNLQGTFQEITKVSDKRGRWYVDGKHLYHEDTRAQSFTRIEKLGFADE